MTLVSVFYDGVVTEGDRAKNRGGVPDYGVYGADDFKVTAHPSIPYAVLVKAGRAHGHGVSDTAAEDEVVQCPTLASPAVRWDVIALRRNWQPLAGGPSTLVVVTAGSSAATPSSLPVGLKKTPGVEDDQPLFLVKWVGGTSAPVQFIDLRCWAGNGGVVAAHTMALEYLAKPASDVLISGVTWRYSLADNGVWGWSSDAAVVLAPLQVSGWQVSGPITVTVEGGKKRVTGMLEVKRTSSVAQGIGGPSFTTLGALIPVSARYAGTIYVPAVLSGSAQRATVHATIAGGTGVVGLRAESGTLSIPENAIVFLYFSYIF